MNREQFNAALYIKPNPAPEREALEKSGTRRFWFLAVPLGLVCAFFVTLLSGSGGTFFPAWVVFSFLIWGLGTPERQ